jgi:hypothetical protein
MPAIRPLNSLGIGPDNVIRFADRNSLPELAQVVGEYMPLGLPLVRSADIDSNAVQRPIVRTPDRAEDQSIIFWLRPVAAVQSGCT